VVVVEATVLSRASFSNAMRGTADVGWVFKAKPLLDSLEITSATSKLLAGACNCTLAKGRGEDAPLSAKPQDDMVSAAKTATKARKFKKNDDMNNCRLGLVTVNLRQNSIIYSRLSNREKRFRAGSTASSVHKTAAYSWGNGGIEPAMQSFFSNFFLMNFLDLH
jgi:hypothetical protein